MGAFCAKVTALRAGAGGGGCCLGGAGGRAGGCCMGGAGGCCFGGAGGRAGGVFPSEAGVSAGESVALSWRRKAAWSRSISARSAVVVSGAGAAS